MTGFLAPQQPAAAATSRRGRARALTGSLWCAVGPVRGSARVLRGWVRRTGGAAGLPGGRGHDARVSKQLMVAVTAALRTPTYVDYRQSFQVAAAAEAVLDMLEDQLNTGTADTARPALLRTVTRLRKIVEYADDSSGVIGAAGQRAALLHARSCREGHPNRVTLARWLVRFRVESPGWPDVTLADYIAAFDEPALAAYRKDVAAADEEHRQQQCETRSECRRGRGPPR